MKHVTVMLSRPWPTAIGLRRPQEGPITVSEEEGARIEAAGAGEVFDAPKGKPKKGAAAAPTAADAGDPADGAAA